ncbi:MAG: hypothetical protein LBH25_12815 [Fibromonadaceae bacterium]|jgi:hypothetical protein|nr:hypothetical protein [Fibromonadaceae bacterium]
MKYCINKGILQDYLRKHSSEVVNMLYTEWKWEDAIAVAKKEAEARGEARGVAKGEARGMNKLLSLLEKGVPLAEAKRKLGIHSNRALR